MRLEHECSAERNVGSLVSSILTAHYVTFISIEKIPAAESQSIDQPDAICASAFAEEVNVPLVITQPSSAL